MRISALVWFAAVDVLTWFLVCSNWEISCISFLLLLFSMFVFVNLRYQNVCWHKTYSILHKHKHKNIFHSFVILLFNRKIYTRYFSGTAQTPGFFFLKWKKRLSICLNMFFVSNLDSTNHHRYWLDIQCHSIWAVFPFALVVLCCSFCAWLIWLYAQGIQWPFTYWCYYPSLSVWSFQVRWWYVCCQYFCPAQHFIFCRTRSFLFNFYPLAHLIPRTLRSWQISKLQAKYLLSSTIESFFLLTRQRNKNVATTYKRSIVPTLQSKKTQSSYKSTAKYI